MIFYNTNTVVISDGVPYPLLTPSTSFTIPYFSLLAAFPKEVIYKAYQVFFIARPGGSLLIAHEQQEVFIIANLLSILQLSCPLVKLRNFESNEEQEFAQENIIFQSLLTYRVL